jgi:hypothetical protein
MPYHETQDAALYHLTANPIFIRENGIMGRLFVDGNIHNNCLLFRLLFDDPGDVVPVVLKVRIGGKIYRYPLSGRDLTNPMVKSPVLKPDSHIEKGLRILTVRPLVSAYTKKRGP